MPTFADSAAALDRARAAFLAQLDAMTDAQRAFRPAGGGWTPAEVAEHLMLVERGLVGGLERQLAAGDARRDVGEPSAEALGRLMDRLESPDTRYAMPDKAATYIAPAGTHGEAVRQEWGALAGRWRALADTLPDALAATGLVRHPLAGAVTAEGAARFAAAHVMHHRGQLDRIEADAAFPLGVAA